MSQPASRLITLILLLQRRPNQKASDLAGALGVSVRTLHRYFAMLDDMGIPVYTERGPHGGFSLARGYKMPPLVLSPEEATALYLGAPLVEEIWGNLYGPAVQGALARLDNLLPEEQRQEIAWARRSLAAIGLQRTDFSLLSLALEKLRRAVHEQRRVDMVYRSGSQPEPRARSLDPYALVFRWGWWYVVGFCHLRQEIRSFRVDRILELELTGQGFQAPSDFDVHAFLAHEFREQPSLKVRLRFSTAAAHVALANRSYWEAVEEQSDGAVVVSFAAPDLAWAASSVLAYGSLVTVLEPEDLRRMVGQWAQAIAAMYPVKPAS
jgi:predicted DNA-binding transcriptional regulator YafY